MKIDNSKKMDSFLSDSTNFSLSTPSSFNTQIYSSSFGNSQGPGVSSYLLNSPSGLQREILPITVEYDHAIENSENIDRSDWDQKVFEMYPNLKDFVERVDPVSRAINFARMYLPVNRYISQETLLSLISQH